MTPKDDRVARTYRAGARIAREQIATGAPEQAAALDGLATSDVIVVTGCYDRVEQVLGALDLPFGSVSPQALAGVELDPNRLLVINCPGKLPQDQIARVAEFVAEGGSLFTTDWALKNVLEPAFPGMVAFNRRPTADDVVRIELKEHDNPFLEGVIDKGEDPQWWLEGSSYPIQIRDRERVQVLITSRELEAKYGEAPVAVLFSHGKGEVFHMISHYYLQRTELRTRRHSMNGTEFAYEKGFSMTPEATEELASLSLGEIESAHSSARLFANWAANSKLRGAATKGPSRT